MSRLDGASTRFCTAGLCSEATQHAADRLGALHGVVITADIIRAHAAGHESPPMTAPSRTVQGQTLAGVPAGEPVQQHCGLTWPRSAVKVTTSQS